MENRNPDYTVTSPVKGIKEGTEKVYWQTLGAGWINAKDGSISINLNALPINNNIVLFKPKPKDAQKRI